MMPQFTPAAQRAIDEAAHYGDHTGYGDLDAPGLLLGLLAEAECRAAAMLHVRGIDADAVRRRWPEWSVRKDRAQADPARFSPQVQASLAEAQARLADYPRPLTLATEHLLLGLAAADTQMAGWLAECGLSAERLEAEIHDLYGVHAEPVEIEDESFPQAIPPVDTSSDGHSSDGIHMKNASNNRDSAVGSASGTPFQPAPGLPVLRIIDAAANRAREGLRAVEDFVRFVLDDRHLTEQLKTLRHDLTAALAGIPRRDRLAARETRADVGTQVTTPGESVRADAADVVAANFTRLAEALRSLEEYTKVIEPPRARQFEALRYRAYTLERAVAITTDSRARLANVRLYVLMDGQSSPEEFQRLAGILVEAGVDAIQLRDKSLDDRQLLARGRCLREVTTGRPTLYIMNDRPDLAVLTRADGVHVGQEELAAKDVRAIVGTDMLVGISTHSLAQARQAVLDGADYIGIGPTFPSATKQFDSFPGVELLRAVAAEVTLPALAIGGIAADNLDQVLQASITRVAVGSAVTSAADPAGKVRRLKERLLSFRGDFHGIQINRRP